MKKDTLYKVNKWNKSAFMPEKNLFDTGGFSFATTKDTNKIFGNSGLSDKAMSGLQKWNQQNAAVNGYNLGKASKTSNFQGAENFQGGGGQSMGDAAWIQAIPGALNGWTVALQDDPQYSTDAHNGFSLVDSTLTQGKKSQVGMGLVNSGASVMNKGLESGNGIMALVGGIAGTLGTIINNGWGYKVNQQRLADVNAGIASNRNFFSNASSLDDIRGPQSVITNTDVYEGGVFTSDKASARNRKLAEQLRESTDWANRTVENNAKWLIDDMDNIALRNYTAFGGPINIKKDMKDNTFDLGGSFDFGVPNTGSTLLNYSLTMDKQALDRERLLKKNLTPTAAFAFGGDTQTNGADYKLGQVYEVTEEEANRLKAMGYGFTVIG